MVRVMRFRKKKTRRRRRIDPVDWPKEISKGKINKFYKSTDWDIAREKALFRDKFICQFYLGKYTEGNHRPHEIKLEEATVVHHIKPIKERPDLCLDIDNLVSLSHEAHEIIEGRWEFQFEKKER